MNHQQKVDHDDTLANLADAEAVLSGARQAADAAQKLRDKAQETVIRLRNLRDEQIEKSQS